MMIKEAQIGPKKIDIPKEWELIPINKLVEVIKGHSYKSKHYSDKENGIIFITLKAIQKRGGFNKEGIKYYEDIIDSKKKVKPGDVIIANTDLNRDAEVVGYPLYVPDFNEDKDIGISMDVSMLKIKGNQIREKFFYYLLSTKLVHDAVKAFAEGSTVLHLDLESFERLNLPLPSLSEQKKIADILSSVDNAIEKTEEIIEENKQLKKGLMQQLLTKGIGHDEFKEVRLGVKQLEIPIEWSVKELGELATVKRGASPRPISDPKWFDDNSEVGWVRISDITRTGKYLTETEQYLSEQGIEKSRLAHKGDLILSICATLGKPSILKTDACLHDGLVGFFDIIENVNTEYLYYALLKNRESLIAKRQTGTQSNLNSTLVRKTQVLVPPLKEQKKIASILSSIDAKIEKEQEYKEELEQLKKGLMQKLLTGEVRVPVEE